MDGKLIENNDQQKYPCIKFTLLGDEKVGKTTITKIFYENNDSKEYQQTLGTDTYKINYLVHDQTIVIKLIDTSSDKRFTTIIQNELKKTNIAFLIFDITKKNSFISLNNWIDLVLSSEKSEISLILIGNKYDLENQREVTEEEIEKFYKEKKLRYYKTSYSNKKDIIKIFKDLIFDLIEDYNSDNNILAKTSVLGVDSILNVSEEFSNFTEMKNNKKIKEKKSCC